MGAAVQPGKFSPLQAKTLEVMAGFDPPFALTGGGALAAFHLKHRPTRDLDLFWHGAANLGEIPVQAERRLREAGLGVERLQTAPAFARLRIADAGETLVLDLVADPVPVVEEPVEVPFGTGVVHVDTPHEILVNKLCALLGRSEVRDLVDLQALLAAGGDLRRALAEAPEKDGGFSPLTFAYVLKTFPIGRLAPDLGLSDEETVRLAAFRDDLVATLAAWTRPEDPASSSER